MGLETFTGWIKDLVSTNPTGTDPKSEGDDHLRGIKQTLKSQFSGFTEGVAVTAKESQLNRAGQYANSLWRRNLLINGGFDIWQRQVSFTITATNTAYTADRWSVRNNTANSATVTRQTFSPGQTAVPDNPKYYMRANVTGNAAATFGVRQRIESVLTGAGGKVTVSFWAAVTSGACTLTPELQQNFGTGGSPSATVGTNGTPITITGTWTRYTQTLDLPSVSGKTLGTDGNDFLQFQLNSNENQSFQLQVTNVQVELGDTATDFEQLPVGETLALCQRYYQNTFPNGSYPGDAGVSSGRMRMIAAGSSNNVFASLDWQFAVRMRTAPTTQCYSISSLATAGSFRDETAGNDVGASASMVSPVHVMWVKTTAPTLNSIYSAQFTADAEL